MSIINLTITRPALTAVQEIIQERQLEGHVLRAYVRESGCCSTREYGLALDPHIHEQDTVLEIEGVRIVMDPASLDYLQGAVIDFVDGPQGKGFTIEVDVACGCGGGHNHQHEEAHSCSCGH